MSLISPLVLFLLQLQTVDPTSPGRSSSLVTSSQSSANPTGCDGFMIDVNHLTDGIFWNLYCCFPVCPALLVIIRNLVHWFMWQAVIFDHFAPVFIALRNVCTVGGHLHVIPCKRQVLCMIGQFSFCGIIRLSLAQFCTHLCALKFM